MRWQLVLLLIVVFGGGCTHCALERNTLNQMATLTDLRYKEVVENFAVAADNPAVLPFFSVIGAGATQVTDTVRSTSRTNWNPVGFALESLFFHVNRTLQENWTLDPVREPRKLEAIRCAVQIVLGGPDAPCPECNDVLTTFRVADRLAKIPPGWLHVGKKCDVPKEACYKSHHHGVYVWVLPDGMEALSQFTLIMMSIANTDMTTLVPEPATKTVTTEEFEYADDKIKKVTSTTTVIDAATGKIVVPRAAGRAPSSDASLRSLIQLRR